MPARITPANSHGDYMDAVRYADEWMNAVTASFLNREERKDWFQRWDVMRFSATQEDIRRIRELTSWAVGRAGAYYSQRATLDAEGFFQMYDMRILASMTVNELSIFNSHLRNGDTDLAYIIYGLAEQALTDASRAAKRTV